LSTVLVVDDSEVTHELVGTVLRRAGHATLHSHDGRAALALLATEAIDVVVADIKMPDLDGFELTEQIRAIPRHESLPVIIYSAYLESTRAQERIADLTAVTLIAKDGEISVLSSAVDSVTHARPADDVGRVVEERVLMRPGPGRTVHAVEREVSGRRSTTYQYRDGTKVLAEAATLQEIMKHIGLA
jgi:CheY-like chemotaxis protein